ncbi:hypothetical protein BC830DRAFT_325292 [Chytriomyces sp. MP71]|nr:hypothetical protein BC830DRAFT_325292 [Chytriomyces sp. MP71]
MSFGSQPTSSSNYIQQCPPPTSQQSRPEPQPATAAPTAFAAAAAGLLPLPGTPSSVLQRMAPPQRITRTHSTLADDTTAASILTDAVAATSLYRASFHHAPAQLQILHTPRRVLEQVQSRAIGMAVMDVMTPVARGAVHAGNLMGRFQEAAAVEVVQNQEREMASPPHAALPVLESPHSAGKTRIPLPTVAMPPPRVLLPNPFDVLGIPQPAKVEQAVVAIKEDVKADGTNHQPTTAPLGNDMNMLDSRYVWKEISPRRVTEGRSDVPGDYRGGIRASIATPAFDGSRADIDAFVPPSVEDLGELEARFKDIAGQLLNCATNAVTSAAAKAAESEEGPAVEMLSRGPQIPDVLTWKPRGTKDEEFFLRPETSAFVGTLDSEAIDGEIGALDEEEKKLVMELMNLKGGFS